MAGVVMISKSIQKLVPIKVLDAETGAYLCEFNPQLNVLKLHHRDRMFVIDLERLASLYERGFRAVKANAASQTKPFIESPE